MNEFIYWPHTMDWSLVSNTTTSDITWQPLLPNQVFTEAVFIDRGVDYKELFTAFEVEDDFNS